MEERENPFVEEINKDKLTTYQSKIIAFHEVHLRTTIIESHTSELSSRRIQVESSLSSRLYPNWVPRVSELNSRKIELHSNMFLCISSDRKSDQFEVCIWIVAVILKKKQLISHWVTHFNVTLAKVNTTSRSSVSFLRNLNLKLSMTIIFFNWAISSTKIPCINETGKLEMFEHNNRNSLVNNDSIPTYRSDPIRIRLGLNSDYGTPVSYTHLTLPTIYSV